MAGDFSDAAREVRLTCRGGPGDFTEGEGRGEIPTEVFFGLFGRKTVARGGGADCGGPVRKEAGPGDDFLQCGRAGGRPKCTLDEALIESVTALLVVEACRRKRAVRSDPKTDETGGGRLLRAPGTGPGRGGFSAASAPRSAPAARYFVNR